MKVMCGKVQGPLSSRMRMWMWMLRFAAILLLFLQLLALGDQLWSEPYQHNQRSLFMSHGSSSSSSSSASSSSSSPSSVSSSASASSSSTTYFWFVADPLRSTHEKPLLHHQRLSSLRRSFSFSHSKDSIMPDPAISHLPPARLYKSNGYLMISCNGGLNQMRAAICDMVAVARLLNLTLIVPELDKTSFWNDPSDFGDIFDTDHFVASLRDEVRIIKEVPRKLRSRVRNGLVLTMPPVSWSNESYYLQQILPLVKRHGIIRFNRTDMRVANGGPGISGGFQKLRCRANYEALAFAPGIRELGQKLVERLRSRGEFLVLHLRYEMDMLAFSGCSHGCSLQEVAELTGLRYAYPWWKEKEIDPQQKRSNGLCPLTPEETLLVLAALGFGNGTQIYIASGEIYGGDRRMKGLYAAYPDMVKKEVLLSRDELARLANHSSQMAALDYLVAIESDVFMATHDGNMAKLVEGHRRYLGYRKTVLLDRKRLVELFDGYGNGTLDWAAFSSGIEEAHKGRMGGPTKRRVVLDRPKEEDYFYSNPHECLHQP